MKNYIYILLLASVSLLCVPFTLAVSSANPKVRAYEQASSSGKSIVNDSTKSATVVFPFLTLKKLTDRMHASIFRIESIHTRIITRVTKMQASGIKVTKINTKLNAFTKQLNVLNKEMETIDKLAATLPSSIEKKKDYTALRSEVAVLRGLLNDSLVSEKAIIADMKILEPIGVAPIVSKTVIKN